MRKVDWPEQEAFLALIDRIKDREQIRYDSTLTEQAGISHAALSNWRHGKVKPSYPLVAAIANAFGENPDDLARVAGLLAGKGADKPIEEQLPPEIEHLARLYRESNKDRREALTNQVRVVIDWFEATSQTGRRRAG